MSNIFKLAIIGGVGYLLYKHYYLPYRDKLDKDSKNKQDFPDDGRTAYFGDTQDEYVRGFPLPENINDIKLKTITVISKPKFEVFGQTPRAMMEVVLMKDLDKVVYFDKNKTEHEKYIVDYNEVKDKLVMTKNYII
jgi:hypothetical protein